MLLHQSERALFMNYFIKSYEIYSSLYTSGWLRYIKKKKREKLRKQRLFEEIIQSENRNGETELQNSWQLRKEIHLSFILLLGSFSSYKRRGQDLLTAQCHTVKTKQLEQKPFKGRKARAKKVTNTRWTFHTHLGSTSNFNGYRYAHAKLKAKFN